MHLAFRLEILLVAKDEKWKVVRVLRHTLFKEIILPILQVVKTLIVSDVTNQDAGLSAAVESGTERLISFLASCIPEL